MQIASFHGSKGLLEPTKPCLQVNDEYTDMLDTIVVTLVYVNRKRKADGVSRSSAEASYASAMYMAGRA